MSPNSSDQRNVGIEIMKTKNYKLAGYAAVLAVVAFILEIMVSFASQSSAYGEVVSQGLVTLTIVLHVAFASYAMYRLRSFLNEQYEYHGTDVLIPLLVGWGIVFALALIGSEYFLAHGAAILLRIGLGVPLGVISMLFGYRLIAVGSDIGGLKKPFAYSHIIAPLCFMSVVLAPLGLLLLLISGTLLALIFFNEEDQELEFV